MSTQLVDAHRADLNYLIGFAQSDLFAIWEQQFGADPVSTVNGLIDVLPDLVDTYGSAATALGADWYEEMRADAGVIGRFAAVTAVLPDRARSVSLARWGVEPLFSATPDVATARSKVAGGLQRIIANADRATVTGSAVRDPRARGWRRAGSGKCGFCQMLIGRGAVYKEATAQFKSHDHCGCIGVPVWL